MCPYARFSVPIDGNGPPLTVGRIAGDSVRRFLALAVNYGAERGVLLAAILVPAALGSTDAGLGRLELLLTSSALASGLGPLGTHNALIFERFRYRRRAWRLSIGVSVVGGFVVGSIAALNLGWADALVGGALGTCLAVHRVSSFRLRIIDSTGRLVLSSSLFAGVFTVGTALVALRGHDPAGPMPIILMVAGLVASIPAFLDVRGDPEGEDARLFGMLRYGLPLSVEAFSSWLVVSADRYVIAAVLGLEAVGPYGVVYRTVMLLSGVLSTAVMWWQSEALRRGFEWARTALRRYVTVMTVLSVAVAGAGWYPMVVVLRRLVDLPSGEIGRLAGWLLVSIVGFIVLMGYQHVFAAAAWVVPSGLLSVGNAFVNLALNFLLVPTLGLTGAAVATAVSQCATAVAAAGFYARRRGRVDRE